MKRKTLCLLLALLLLGVSAAGCAQDPKETEDSSTSASVTADETEAAEAEAGEENTDVPDDLPAKDFDGAKFSILTTTWYNAKTYIYADELTGEVINDALYNQRADVSERFNVDITCTANDDYGVVGTTVHNLVMSGDSSYDIAYNHDNQSMNNTMQGDYCNLRSFDLINFDKPWWQGASQVFTIQNKLFATANPLALSGIYMNCSVSINKGLAADLQSDMGAGILDKDETGSLYFVNDLEKIVSVMEKFDTLTEYAQISGGTDYNVAMFSEGRGLFMFSENRNLYESMRDSDVSYGILPCPKFDESQETYASAGFDIYWGVILSAAGNEEVISYCVEAMSCYNYNKVIPQVWETVLGSKLSDSADDSDMFRIIRDIQYVDLGYAFQGENGSLGQLVFLKSNTNADQTASYINARAKALNKSLDKLNSKYAEMGE